MKKLNKKIALISAGLTLMGTGVISTATMQTPVVSAATKVDLAKVKVSQSKAVDKFTKKYGKKSIDEIELKLYKKTALYQIDGFDKTHEYEVQVDAQTGKVVKSKSAKLAKGEKKYALDLKKTITATQAIKIAKKHAKGEVTDLSLEKKGSKYVWDVEVKASSKTKHKVEINAKTKKVIRVTKEN